jgi:hypothetical protein
MKAASEATRFQRDRLSVTAPVRRLQTGASVDHSDLMLATRITRPHFSVVAAISVRNSAAVLGIGIAVSSRSRWGAHADLGRAC